MARPSTYPNDQAASLRNLKFLVVLLAVSNIVIGGISVYLLHGVDQRYSELVGRAVPALNDLRELMTDTVFAMRATNARNFSGPESTHSAAIQTIRTTHQTTLDFRAKLLADDKLKDEAEAINLIRKTGDAFDAAVREVMQIYSTGKIADATRVREEHLLPAFDRHLASIAKAADALESLSLGASKDYTAKTNTLSAIVLSVASWPVLVLALLLLVTALFVIVMMIAFRGKDMVDAP